MSEALAPKGAVSPSAELPLDQPRAIVIRHAEKRFTYRFRRISDTVRVVRVFCRYNVAALFAVDPEDPELLGMIGKGLKRTG